MNRRKLKDLEPAAPPQFASEALDVGDFRKHRIEQEVQRELLSEPTVRFASLVVRRLNKGICLQGVVEADDNAPDLSAIAQRVAGVEQVLNHLLVTPRREFPAKG